EVDRLGRRPLRRDDQVALVLAVLVIDQDEHPALAGFLDDILGRGLHLAEGHPPSVLFERTHGLCSHSRCTYRASMSSSRLSRWPGLAVPRVVTAWVCEMMFTPKRLPSTSFTVSEIPSTAIEPLEAMKRASSPGASNTKRTLPPSDAIDAIRPTPSTWP